MKFWVQCSIGCIVGAILAFIPGLDGMLRGALPEITKTIRFAGRFLLSFIIVIGLPLSIIAASKRNNSPGSLFRIIGIVLLLLFSSSFLGYLVGIFLLPDRLPPQFQEEVFIERQPILTTIQELFPANAFELFTPHSDNILSLCIFAAILAFIAITEQKHGRANIHFFLEVSWSALWKLLRIGTSVGAGFLVVLTFDTIGQFITLTEESVFASLFIILLTSVLFISLGVFPAILSMIRGENIFSQWITSFVPPALFALCSGDVLYSLPGLYRSTAESLAFPHPIYSTRLVMTTLFCRLGSVFIAAVCSIVVIRSYSALTITLAQSLLIIFVIPAYAIFVFNNPYTNILLILSGIAPFLLGAGSSMYLILVPMFIVLQRLAAMLDCAGVLFILALKKERVLQETQDSKFFHKRHRILNEDAP